VIALGIGFGTPLAIAGVVIHVAGHGLAKSLGFYAALPLVRADRDAASAPPSAVIAKSRPTAWAMGVSLGALGGVPPSPLFVSELLILLGGFRAHDTVVAAIAALALALGFLGLLHALIEGVIGVPAPRVRRVRHRGEHAIALLTATTGAGLIALTVASVALADSAFVATLARGAL
jgi:hydrogenase-4 component F